MDYYKAHAGVYQDFPLAHVISSFLMPTIREPMAFIPWILGESGNAGILKTSCTYFGTPPPPRVGFRV